MPALDNGWMKIDTTSGSGTTAIAVVVLERNTGRTVSREQSIVGTNAHGVTATATIRQEAMGPFVVIDHIDQKGQSVTQLANTGGLRTIVGYANLDFISITETSDGYTDMNDQDSEAYTNGIVVIEHGVTHNNVPLESPMLYGEDEQYMFEIPFIIEDNSETTPRMVSFLIENEDGDVSLQFNIMQEGYDNT